MSHQQSFTETLRRQVNELHSANLDLQHRLAQKDDKLAEVKRQLQDATSEPKQAETRVRELEKSMDELRQQLQQARDAAEASESELNQTLGEVANLRGRLKENSTARNHLENELIRVAGQLHTLEDDYAAFWDRGESKERDSNQNGAPVGTLRTSENVDQTQGEKEDEVLARPQRAPANAVSEESKSCRDNLQEQQHSSLPNLAKSNCGERQSSAQACHPQETHSERDDRRPPQSGAFSSGLSANGHKRRHHDRDEEVAADLEDLDIGDPPSEPKRRRTCTQSSSPGPGDSETGVRQQAIRNLKKNFHFTAVAEYDAQDGLEKFYDSKDDLKNCVADLWDLVLLAHEGWEESRGDAWEHEFRVRLRGRRASSCVSAKLKAEGWESGRSKWIGGDVGKYACKKCVKLGMPCFFWNGETFKLLPLHERDRKWHVRKDLEVRYWLNIP